jgi:hypothetical protein
VAASQAAAAAELSSGGSDSESGSDDDAPAPEPAPVEPPKTRVRKPRVAPAPAPTTPAPATPVTPGGADPAAPKPPSHRTLLRRAKLAAEAAAAAAFTASVEVELDRGTLASAPAKTAVPAPASTATAAGGDAGVYMWFAAGAAPVPPFYGPDARAAIDALRPFAALVHARKPVARPGDAAVLAAGLPDLRPLARALRAGTPPADAPALVVAAAAFATPLGFAYFCGLPCPAAWAGAAHDKTLAESYYAVLDALRAALA